MRPIADEHTGRFGVAIEPIAEDKVGRVVFAGVVAARVNVQETWHQYADVANSGGTTLQSKPNGSAQILWRRDTNQTASSGLLFEWKTSRSSFLVKVPSGGIPGRSGLATGSASCDLFQLDDSGTIEAVRKPNGQGVRIIARNRAPSGFEVRFPTTKVNNISALPLMAIVPGSSTRPSKHCSANQYLVSRQKAGEWLANCGMPTESGHQSA